MSAQLSKISGNILNRIKTGGMGGGELFGTTASEDEIKFNGFGHYVHHKEVDGREVDTLIIDGTEGLLNKSVDEDLGINSKEVQIKFGRNGVSGRVITKSDGLKQIDTKLDTRSSIHASAQILAKERDTTSKRRAATKAIIDEVTNA